MGTLKKKAYAHIPGLSTTATPSIQDTLQTNNQISTQESSIHSIHQPEVVSAGYFDLKAPQPFISPDYNTVEQPLQEPTNKFSLGTLFPAATQLLQKIPSVQNFTQPKSSSDLLEYTPNSANSDSVFTVETSEPNFQSVSQSQTYAPPPSIQTYNFNTSPFLESSPRTVTDISSESPRVNERISKVETPIDQIAPPIFFSASQVSVVPKQVFSKSGNPYGKSRFGKAVYKNPSLIPLTGTTPILLNSGLETNNNILNPTNVAEESTQLLTIEKISPSTGPSISSEFISNPVNSLIFDSTKDITDHTTEFTSLTQPKTVTNQITPHFTPSIQTTSELVSQDPLSLIQPNVQPPTPFNFFLNNQNQQNTTGIDTKAQVFEDLPTNYPPPLESVDKLVVKNPSNTSLSGSQDQENQPDIFHSLTTVKDSLNNNKVPWDSKEETKSNIFFNVSSESKTSTASNIINTEVHKKDNEIPRFTPVQFFTDDPKISENALVSLNNNSAVDFIQKQYPTFFDKTTTEVTGPINKPAFENDNNNSLGHYFKLLPQEKLINQDIIADSSDQSVYAAQTSSFSSFRSESISELNQVKFVFSL